MKRFLTITILFFTFHLFCFSQNIKDTLLIFNNKTPLKIKKHQFVYYIEDIIATDSVKINLSGYKITEFTVTSNCQTNYVDLWQKTNNGCILDSGIKNILSSCIDYNSNSGFIIVYFEDVKAIDKSGNYILIKSIRIKVKHLT